MGQEVFTISSRISKYLNKIRALFQNPQGYNLAVGSQRMVTNSSELVG